VPDLGVKRARARAPATRRECHLLRKRMARSPLTNTSPARRRNPRRGDDVDALGPSDSSDTGSDVANIPSTDTADAGEPVDAATGDRVQRARTPAESLAGGSTSDALGTGERRTGAGDGGIREGADIDADHIVQGPPDTPPGEDAEPPRSEADDGGDSYVGRRLRRRERG
jgi:hypothetical protein